jgi:hypothetical protein
MGETQASNNWRGNETFSKPRPFRDEVIDMEKAFRETMHPLNAWHFFHK